MTCKLKADRMYKNCILLVWSNTSTLVQSTNNSITRHFSCDVHYFGVEKIAMAKFFSVIQFSILAQQGQTSKKTVTYLHVPS